jgi:hypothetical protein
MKPRNLVPFPKSIFKKRLSELKPGETFNPEEIDYSHDENVVCTFLECEQCRRLFGKDTDHE